VNDTCREVVTIISQKLGITESQDLFLVYTSGKQELILDNDEYIFTAVKHLEDTYRKEEQDKRMTATTRASIFNSSRDYLGCFAPDA
jgi:hypothetical protein